MARQEIILGINDNDGTGDKLRVAMRKVNENFVELYAQTSINTNIEFSNARISTPVVNGNLTIDPNGTGKMIVTTGAVFNSSQQPNSLVTFIDSTGGTYITINPLNKNVGINTAGTNAGLDVVGTVTLSSGNPSDQINLNANVYLGDQSSNNTINFNGGVNTDIIPYTNGDFDLGSAGSRFKNIYSQAIYSNSAVITSATISTVVASAYNNQGDSIMGNLIVRNNEISNTVIGEDIEIKPYGVGKVTIATKLAVGVGIDSNHTLQVKGDLKVENAIVTNEINVPSSSIGDAGDKAGMTKIGPNYIYHCVADYDGTTDIWKRVAFTGGPW